MGHGIEQDHDKRRAVWSSAEWITYFEENAKSLLCIPWETGVKLTPEERQLVAASLPSWQLGESSDGARLMAAARHHAERIGDPGFIEVMRMFISEEQRHGGDLGRVLDLAGIPRKTFDWGDAVFRRIRHLMTRMELNCCVLITVEIHAMMYYAAIRKATRSEVLRRVCQQILADEVPHIRFQCERLAILHQKRPRFLRSLTLALHRVLFTGVTLAIWFGHGRALRAGGFGFRRFWSTSWAKLNNAWKMMDPRGYRWPTPDARIAKRRIAIGD